MNLERNFDSGFASRLALREKQIQQSYRPIIGVHKWFARRPGTVFRALLLAEFNGSEPLGSSYWRAHKFRGVIADPFMGGGSPVFEASRLGFHVVATDINPMAFWVVRQSLAPLNIEQFEGAAAQVIADVERRVGRFYRTRCGGCGESAPVKYFLWVKTAACPECTEAVDLFPGYLLAEDARHPKHVLACRHCGTLNECDEVPRRDSPDRCVKCGKDVVVEGPVRRGSVECGACGHRFAYLSKGIRRPLGHRLWALEYFCPACKGHHRGRFFKAPDRADLARFRSAARALDGSRDLPIPDDPIPPGDETDRLHRWGYRRYREMFNARQLLGLGLLLETIQGVKDEPIRHALLTVFSDFLRYQNMLCRYDTYALKCQDIFSVHGFPVGLLACENSLLGIPGVGSGSFRHFVEKYVRAKRYCEHPFEVALDPGRKRTQAVAGERIAPALTETFPQGAEPEALLSGEGALSVALPARSLDGVFTDPPYFDNVQYAELMDFCFVWLRKELRGAFRVFRGGSTRSPGELTGNVTLGRGIEHFTGGLSAVFQHYAKALKPGAPFVFTYHHNAASAYAPIVVSILDAGLVCTATLPVAAEMAASLHIAGTGSSVFDSVFVCRTSASVGDERAVRGPADAAKECVDALDGDVAALREAGIELEPGDLRCLAAGHVARLVVAMLRARWDLARPLAARIALAGEALTAVGGLLERNGLDPAALRRTRRSSTIRTTDDAAAV